MQVLLVDPPHGGLPPGTLDLVRQMGWTPALASDYSRALEESRRGSIDVIIMPAPTEGDAKPDGSTVKSLLRLIELERIATFIVGDTDGSRALAPHSDVDIVDRDVSLAELRGRLAMIQRYHERFRRMEREIRNMERLGKRLNQHFREVDQEMRLAARLQQDFLPRVDEPIGNLQFATLYRPASWVSGDIYDIFRIDEDHTGFYVADAVGHGIAASLLTMFIKRSVVPKRVTGQSYEVLPPSAVMAELNDALTEQSLPNCQFITAWYGLIDHRTLQMRYARGGHPYPVLVTKDGVVSQLKSSGPLLGLFKGEDFTDHQVELTPGDKLVLFTDGVELAFQDEPDTEVLDTTAYMTAFRRAAAQPVRDMLLTIDGLLDAERGSLNPRDDLTIVAVEMLTP